MDQPSRESPQLVLEHLAWIRRLARELVADRNAAEDLAQDAVLVALRAPPRDQVDPRRWFGGVLRNLARQRTRRDARRADREALAARSDAVDSLEEVVARVELERELVQAVLELDEPYRGAVLLRWFEELPPRAIAERLQIPVATVDSRLQRALATLRARLDRSHGDRRAWSAAILQTSIARSGAASTSLPHSLAALGGTLMKVKLALLAVALVAAGAAVLVWSRRASNPADEVSPPVVSSGPELPRGPAAKQVEVPDAARIADRTRAPLAPGDSNSAASSAAPIASKWTVRGRVLDGDGHACAAITLSVDGASAPSASRPDGSFEFEAQRDRVRISAADSAWVTVRSAVARKGSNFEAVVIVAPSIELSGRAFDDERRPLEHARIHFELPRDFDARFALPLEATERSAWLATSAADGSFALTKVPSIAGAKLRATLEGYVAPESDAPRASSKSIEFVFERPKVPMSGALRGRVVDRAAKPVAGARVATGVESVTSAADGSFEIDLAHAITAESLTAVKVGLLPARVDRPNEPSEGKSGWPDFVTLELGSPSLAIAGTLVDLDDHPIAGAKLWLADPTPFGVVGMMPTSVENLMAGAAIPPAALEAPRPPRDGDSFNDLWFPAGPPSALWNWVASDEHGRFEIGGLEDREYRLAVLVQKPLAISTSTSIHAGTTDAHVRIERPAIFEHLRGRVVSDRGAPIAGVSLRARVNLADVRGRVFGGRIQLLVVQPAASATTDEQGRFDLGAVTQAGTEIDLESDEIVPDVFHVTPSTHADDATIAVHVRCHLQVELEEPFDRADGAALRDGDDKPLDLFVIEAGSINAFTDVPVSDGRSQIFSVSSAAKTLVLLKAGVEVGRLAVELSPAEVTHLRW